MNKIGKTALINRLELKGIPVPTATKILDLMSDIFAEELCKGNSISINRVATITPVIKKEKEMPVAGVIKKIPERVRLKVTMSKVLSDKYKKQFSSTTKKKNEMRSIGDTFLKS